MELRISNVAGTSAAFTDERGDVWGGLACHFEGATLVIEADGDTASAARAWLTAGNQPIAYSAPPPIETDYADAIQALIDQTARSRRYADGVSLASYGTSTNPQWAAEAAAFSEWRDAVWLYAYGEFAKVEAGQRVAPATAELISELPVIAWPG